MPILQLLKVESHSFTLASCGTFLILILSRITVALCWVRSEFLKCCIIVAAVVSSVFYNVLYICLISSSFVTADVVVK